MRLFIAVLLLVTVIKLADSAASQCYNCLEVGCGDPFDANAGSTKGATINGWCIKFKKASDGKVDRLPDTGVCTANKCEKATLQGMEGTRCCCNSELCNASPRSVSTMGISLIVGLVLLSFASRFY